TELAALVADRDAIGEARAIAAQLIQSAGDFARVAAALGQLLLELIDFLEDVNRDDDLVIGEFEDRLRIVQEHVGIEDEVLSHEVSEGCTGLGGCKSMASWVRCRPRKMGSSPFVMLSHLHDFSR